MISPKRNSIPKNKYIYNSADMKSRAYSIVCPALFPIPWYDLQQC